MLVTVVQTYEITWGQTATDRLICFVTMLGYINLNYRINEYCTGVSQFWHADYRCQRLNEMNASVFAAVSHCGHFQSTDSLSEYHFWNSAKVVEQLFWAAEFRTVRLFETFSVTSAGIYTKVMVETWSIQYAVLFGMLNDEYIPLHRLLVCCIQIILYVFSAVADYCFAFVQCIFEL